MTEREFQELLARGYETRGVEFKGPGRRDDSYFFAKVCRAVLGMANKRDGGVVIIGVDDDRGKLIPTGLNQEQLETWTYEYTAALLAQYADPYVSIEFELFEYKNSKFTVLHVHEFEDVPILCRKGFNLDRDTVLREGACYVRSRRTSETSEIASHGEMRELLDLAIDKGVRKFIERSHRSGISSLTALPSDQELFDEQLRDLR